MDEAEGGKGDGIFAGHVAEGYVGKNNVRRHAAFAGEGTAQFAQAIEQRLVARKIAHAGLAFFLFGFGHDRLC